MCSLFVSISVQLLSTFNTQRWHCFVILICLQMARPGYPPALWGWSYRHLLPKEPISIPIPVATGVSEETVASKETVASEEQDGGMARSELIASKDSKERTTCSDVSAHIYLK